MSKTTTKEVKDGVTIISVSMEKVRELAIRLHEISKDCTPFELQAAVNLFYFEGGRAMASTQAMDEAVASLFASRGGPTA